LVKRKIRDVDCAGTLVDCRRYPKNFARAEYNHVGLIRDLVLAVGAAAKTIGKTVSGSPLLYCAN
jgi:hypothetical protein